MPLNERYEVWRRTKRQYSMPQPDVVAREIRDAPIFAQWIWRVKTAPLDSYASLSTYAVFLAAAAIPSFRLLADDRGCPGPSQYGRDGL
ncbi:MAG TPA: hypothetical protein VEJ67_17775 [Candidatus Cybelea sp.]|nr:hypothetical protein [Candidatus Cybelea sp.]